MSGIAISGKAGSGKSTLARHIISAFEKRGRFDTILCAFGDALKDEAFQRYGIKKGDPVGRAVLVYHGERRRAGDPLYWIARLEETIDAVGTPLPVVDDLRFPTELAWAKGRGMVTVRLEASDNTRRQRLVAAGHDPSIVGYAEAGETSLDSCLDHFDHVIHNDGSTDLAELGRSLACYFEPAYA